MSDRPIAAILAGIAAMGFVAAFAAAAVMRPSTAAVVDKASAPTAPAAAVETLPVTKLAAPSLAPVAALPALHLPKPKPARKRVRRIPQPRVAAPVTAVPTVTVTPTPTATAVPTAAPPRVVTPPRSNIGQTFDSEG